MEITFCGFNMRHMDGFRLRRPNGTRDYLLLIFRSPIYIRLGGETRYITKHSVILFNRHTPQFFGSHNAEFVNDWFQFEADRQELRFLEQIGIPFDTLMEFNDVYEFSNIVKQICNETWSNHKNAKKTTDLLIRLLFLKLSDQWAMLPVADTHLAEQLNTLRNNIYNKPARDWSIPAICESLSLSPSYLQHKYKQMFGTNIKKDVTASRIRYGKYLLANTDHTILRISQMAGYENDVHFMRVFKKETGFTPSQYRKASMQNKPSITKA